MNKPIPPIETVSTSSQREIMETLQAQMERYANMAASASATANADLRSLQNAVKSGDIIGAQTAVDRLQRDETAQAALTGTSGSIAVSNTSAPSVNTPKLNAVA